VLLGAESKRVHVDAAVRGAGVREERLHEVEVGAFALREAILTVELKLGRDHWVLAPAVELERSLGEHEGASVRHVGLGGALGDGEVRAGEEVRGASLRGLVPHLIVDDARAVNGAGGLEEAGRIDEAVVDAARAASGDGLRTAKRMDGVGERINRVGVVEGLSAEGAVEHGVAVEGRAVVDVLVGLHDPDELLDGVVEVELDFVGGGADGLVAGELELLDEVLVRVLGHAAALVGVEEDVVHVERGGHERLVVRRGDLEAASGGRGTRTAAEVADRPEALVDGAKVDVDAHLVVLEGNEGERQARVLAEPELERDVEGGLRKSVTRRANLARGVGLARAVDGGEGGVRDVGQLGSVADHGEVALLLGGGHGELVPDVHPVAVLAVNALAADLDLHLGDELLAREVEPAGEHAVGGRGRGATVSHVLVDFRKSYLEDSGVGQVAVTRDGAGHAATEIGLTVEGLLNGLHGKVGVAAVRHFPESNLRVTSKIHVLGAVGNKLHQSASHGYIMAKEKKIGKFEFK